MVDESIRRLVDFKALNLALDVYPSDTTRTREMDLILCRNVLIYFDMKLVRAVARRLYSSLAEGGWLITASSDPQLSDEAPFESVVTEQGVFYSRGTASWDAPLIDDTQGRRRREMAARAARTCAPVQVGRSHSASPVSPAGQNRDDTAVSGLRMEKPNAQAAPREPGLAGRVVLAAARADLARGDYARASDRARGLADDLADAAALHVRALANLDPVKAELACARATRRHWLSGELHYLHALTLLALGRDADAARSARRALYLDRSLAIVHFTLGSILRRGGDLPGAMRAFRNSIDLCDARPRDEFVPLSDGEPGGRLAEAARDQMSQMMASSEAP